MHAIYPIQNLSSIEAHPPVEHVRREKLPPGVIVRSQKIPPVKQGAITKVTKYLQEAGLGNYYMANSCIISSSGYKSIAIYSTY